MSYKNLLLSYRAGEITKESLKDRLSSLSLESSYTGLTEGQRGLWSIANTRPESNAYNVPMCLHIQDAISADMVKLASTAIVNKNPILNSKVVIEAGDLRFKHKAVKAIDVITMDVSGVTENDCNRLIQEHIDQPFDLDHGPLIRCCLFSRSSHEHYLLFVAHHIAFDGMSAVIFLEQFIENYRKVSEGKVIEDKYASTGYADFVQWERSYLTGDSAAAHLNFWEQQYRAGMPNTHLLGDLEGTGEVRSCTTVKRFSENISRRATDYCSRSNISESTFFLTAFNMILHCMSGDDSVVVGMPIMVRPEVRFDEVIGYFVNVLAVRSGDLAAKPFSKLAQEVSKTVLEMADHAAYPFPKMVREMGFKPDDQQAPIFRIMYAYQNFISAGNASKLSSGADSPFRFRVADEFQQSTDYELALEVGKRDDVYQMSLKYLSSKYSEVWIDTFLTQLERLVDKVLQTPSLTGHDLVKDGSDSAYALNRLHEEAPEQAFAEDLCLHELFSQRAARIPEKLALTTNDRQYTYAEIDAITDSIALRLVSLGVERETNVALCMDRSADVLISVLAILKAGGVYVPLDPSHPKQRLSYVMQDCAPRLVIADKRYTAKLETALGSNGPTDVYTLDTLNAIDCDFDAKDLLQGRARASDLAYILYTSGSTGTPKGVMVEHRNILNTLFALEQAYPMTDDSRYLFKTNYIFDVSIAELFGWFVGCGTLVVLPNGEEAEPKKLLRALIEEKITHVNFVPSMLTTFLCSLTKDELAKARELNYVFVAGEAFTASLMRLCKQTLGRSVRVENIYGPTEISIYGTWFSLVSQSPTAEYVPIGKVLPNVKAYILDENGKRVSMGTSGELCISGPGVARGYWNKPELTNDKFVDNAFDSPHKMYKTGDRVSLLADGNIKYIGRMDDQVKIRGYRIEIGAIESCLLDHPGIKQCAVIVKESEFNKQLVAYYVAHDIAPSGMRISKNELHTHVGEVHPEYMIPAFFIAVDIMPLTNSGKVDRKRLADKPIDITRQRNDANVVRFEKSAIERDLTALWEKILGVKNIGLDDGFFDVGGDSINLSMMIKSVNEKYSCSIDRSDIFEHSNIRRLRDHISTVMQRSDAPMNDKPGRREIENVIQMSPAKASRKSTSATHHPSLKYPKYYESSLAVVGVSGAFPDADDTSAFWDNLISGKESVRLLSREELVAKGLSDALLDNDKYVPVQSSIANKEGFDPEFFSITPKDALLIDPQYRHLLMHAWKAVEDGGYAVNNIPRTGVFVSASTSFYQGLAGKKTTDTASKALELNEYSSWVLSQSGTAPTMISHKLGLTGPSMHVHTNCSSSLVALDLAKKAILAGDCDYALVGAATVLANDVPGYIHQSGMNFSSDGHIRAFDEKADGMVVGEGVSVLLLKRADKAMDDGDNIYSIIRDVSTNNDGDDKVGYYAPGYHGQVSVIERCLDKTGIDPSSIQYVEAHGTGTKLGDPVEVKALSDVYQKHTNEKQFCGLGSVKSNIGHLDSAAGLAGLVKVSLSLKAGIIPPTINCDTPNPAIHFEDSPFYVVSQPTKFKDDFDVYRAAVSSFGLGGTNTHAILERAVDRAQDHNLGHEEDDGKAYLFPVSAKTRKQLLEAVLRLKTFVDESKGDSILPRSLSYTLQVGRVQMACRCCFIATSLTELKMLLQQFVEGSGETAKTYISQEMGKADTANAYYEEDDATLLFNEWCKAESYDKLARMWVSGSCFQWRNLWLKGGENNAPPKVNLPGYPFSLKRFWLGDSVAPSGNSARVKEAIDVSLLSASDKPAVNVLSTDTDNGTTQYRAILNFVLDSLSSATGIAKDNISINADLIEMGLDSLAFLGVIKEIKDAYGVEISQSQLFENLSSLEKISVHVSEKLAHANSAEPTQSVSTIQDAKEVSSASGAVLAFILHALSTATGIAKENIEVESDLIEMGLDSLAFLGVVKEIKDEYHIEISQTQLFDELSSLNKIAAYVSSALTSNPSATMKDSSSSSSLSDEVPTRQGTQIEQGKTHPVAPDPIQKGVAVSANSTINEAFTSSYNHKTQGSKLLADTNRPYLADSRAVAGLRPSIKQLVYPIVGDEAEGAFFNDVDGNEFMDVSMGFGVLLFGHKPPFVEQALLKQVRKGLQIGPQSKLAGDVAKLVCDITGVERVAFCNTGSEAVMVAIRLVRAYTGKRKIAIFRNAYHGHFDGVLPGINAHDDEDLLELDYDSPESLDLIAQNKDQLAGVIVEPVQSRRPDLQPRAFLQNLRHLTEQYDIPLIFDEVLTGFRIAGGGAQSYFDVQADVVTYGKIIGGGLPVAAVAGKAKIMDLIDGGQWRFDDDSYPSHNRIMFVGTYNKNSLAMAASHAVLSHIKQQGESMYTLLNDKSQRFYDALNASFKYQGLPLEVVSFGSLFRFKSSVPIEDLYYHLIHSGVYVWEGRNCFISTNMDDTYLNRLKTKIIDAARAAFTPNKRMGCTTGNDVVSDEVLAHDTLTSRSYLTEEM